MAGFYILSSKGQLSKCDEHLLFKDKDGKTIRILPHDTEKIVIYDTVSITGEAFSILARNKIPVTIKTFGSKEGIFLDYGDGKNAFLRQIQYKIVDDDEKSLEIAKMIVRGKIKNQLAFIQRIKRSENQGEAFKDEIRAIKENLAHTDSCATLPELRGTEGTASRAYFSVIKNHIKPGWAVFERRSKNPPESNVNAALSFIYSLLSNEVLIASRSAGLDCMAGTLHELCYGKNALVFDLMEEFRTPCADTLCCNLINHGILQKGDFFQDGDAFYLTKIGMKKTTAAFEEKMNKDIKYDGKETSLRKIIFSQSQNYKDMILERCEKYSPFAFK